MSSGTSVVRALVAALALGLSPSLAAAQASVGVVVVGCPGFAPDVATSLGLELGPAVQVDARDTSGSATNVMVEMRACEASSWTMRVLASDGRVLFGPEEISMSEFSDHARVRIAALWAADRLARLETAAPVAALEPSAEPSESIAQPAAEPQPDDASAAQPSALSPSAAQPSALSPSAAQPSALSQLASPAAAIPPVPPEYQEDGQGIPTFMVGVGGAGFVDPAQLALGAGLVRVGLGAQLHPHFFLSGSLEGGILAEPFDHLQPFLRLCAEPQFHLPLDAGFALALGPRGCASGSRHQRDAAEEWTAGVALGGLVRFSMSLGGGLGIGVRLDVDAWERDALAETSQSTRVGAATPDLPWVGVFAGSVELSVF